MATRVILIHGANPNGVWQEKVCRLLEPSFKCEIYAYRGYRGWIGLVGTVVNLFWSLGCFAATYAAIRLAFPAARRITDPAGWEGLAISLLVGAAAGFLGAYLRRESAAQAFAEWLGDLENSGESTHLIAHSLGTFLTGRALARFPELNCGQVILAGGILPSRYPWEIRLEQERCAGVWNEQGRRDFVVPVAAVLGLGSFGQSGFSGFSGALVHDLVDAYSACNPCQPGGLGRNVHNVLYIYGGHSDFYVTRGRTSTVWLPLLLGIEPAHFDRWTRLCSDVANYVALEIDPETQGRYCTALNHAIDALREGSWPWTAIKNQPATLGHKLAEEARARIKPPPSGGVTDEMVTNLAEIALLRLAVKVTTAVGRIGQDGARGDEVWPLLPSTAIDGTFTELLADFHLN